MRQFEGEIAPIASESLVPMKVSGIASHHNIPYIFLLQGGPELQYFHVENIHQAYLLIKGLRVITILLMVCWILYNFVAIRNRSLYDRPRLSRSKSISAFSKAAV